MIGGPVKCRQCGGEVWRVLRTGNDEPEDPTKDLMSTVATVCGQCDSPAMSIRRWYDGSYEVRAFGEVVVTNRPAPAGGGEATREGARVLSFLAPDQVARLGRLPPEGMVGRLSGDTLDEAGFQANPAFVEFLHEVIRTAGPDDPGLRAAAAAQGEGWVYVIDLRTPGGPQGRVPPEDIVGGFKVEAGRMVEGSYWPNAKHRVFTRHGMVQLPPPLHEALVQELVRRAATAGGREDA